MSMAMFGRDRGRSSPRNMAAVMQQRFSIRGFTSPPDQCNGRPIPHLSSRLPSGATRDDAAAFQAAFRISLWNPALPGAVCLDESQSER